MTESDGKSLQQVIRQTQKHILEEYGRVRISGNMCIAACAFLSQLQPLLLFFMLVPHKQEVKQDLSSGGVAHFFRRVF